MVLNGLTNTANLAEIINSRLEEINLACKDCLIELDEASEGSLILYLEVQNEIFQSDDLFHGKMDSFVKILFEVISFKPEISIYSYILILHDGKLLYILKFYIYYIYTISILEIINYIVCL